MSNEDLDWTPVARGEIYCSPACGADCTKAEFELATMRADILCARLNAMPGGFKDWRPRVWENLGWHYEALRDVPNVNGTRPCDDDCSVDECLNSSGNPYRYYCSIVINGVQFSQEAQTPEQALMATMAEIRDLHQQFETHYSKFRTV